jgi:hypothetical protein
MSPGRVQHVGRDHGIGPDAAGLEAEFLKDGPVVLQVLPDLLVARVFEERAQAVEHVVHRQLLRLAARKARAVANGNVIAGAIPLKASPSVQERCCRLL